jgi:hypothetical protein
MTRTIAIVATAAALSFGTIASAQSMGEGYNMLQAALISDFQDLGIPTDALDDLTLSQIAAIKDIVESQDGSSQKAGQIEAIIANN